MSVVRLLVTGIRCVLCFVKILCCIIVNDTIAHTDVFKSLMMFLVCVSLDIWYGFHSLCNCFMCTNGTDNVSSMPRNRLATWCYKEVML